jgi:hypothetical protein
MVTKERERKDSSVLRLCTLISLKRKPLPSKGYVHFASSLARCTCANTLQLEALGFERQMVLQAYMLCDKNEELAANFLFDSGEDDMP